MSAAKMRRGTFVRVMISMLMTALVFGNVGLGIEKMLLKKSLGESKLETQACQNVQEKLILGTPYAVERKEGGDTVRYTVTPSVKKEVLMFVPVQ